ncbi:Polycystic kidney disease and receptor for egg jelly-related protein [Aphelenchoides fujianensis]|nr:Polycystic kidney disease and receptor for egg jelly-related protein [Aphelenchoides fujianensis]
MKADAAPTETVELQDALPLVEHPLLTAREPGSPLASGRNSLRESVEPESIRSPSLRAVSTPSSQRTIEFASYSVVVRTGTAPNAGTYANVFIQLTDSAGNQTDKCRLKCSITHRHKFCRGHADLFMLVDQNVLNDVRYVDVWHERKQAGTSWQLTSVEVVEHITHMRLEMGFPPIQVLRHEDFLVYN